MSGRFHKGIKRGYDVSLGPPSVEYLSNRVADRVAQGAIRCSDKDQAGGWMQETSDWITRTEPGGGDRVVG